MLDRRTIANLWPADGLAAEEPLSRHLGPIKAIEYRQHNVALGTKL